MRKQFLIFFVLFLTGLSCTDPAQNNDVFETSNTVNSVAAVTEMPVLFDKEVAMEYIGTHNVQLYNIINGAELYTITPMPDEWVSAISGAENIEITKDTICVCVKYVVHCRWEWKVKNNVGEFIRVCKYVCDKFRCTPIPPCYNCPPPGY